MTSRRRSTAGLTGRQWWLSLFFTPLLFATVWWVITHGSTASWLVGLPALLAATWASRYLGRASDISVSPLGLVRFVVLFLWESLRGGVDVALRTLAPRMRIQTDFIRYRTGLGRLSARTFFANCVSLLPGTLAADLQDDWLEVHVLNVNSDHETELARLERAVARMFNDSGGSK